MALKYWEEIEDISEDMYFETEDRYYKVMFSDLSLLQMIISLGNKDIDINNIKSRSNNIFYSNCIYHNAVDYPVRINEKSKTCTCFGCGKNFSIITLGAIGWGGWNVYKCLKRLDELNEEEKWVMEHEHSDIHSSKTIASPTTKSTGTRLRSKTWAK